MTGVPSRSLPDESRAIRDLLLENLHSSQELGIITLNRDAAVTYWNAGAEQLFGIPAAAAYGKPFAALTGSRLRPEQQQMLSQALAASVDWSGIPYERRSDGADLLVALLVSPLRDSDRNDRGKLIVARNVTERLQAEAAREDLAAIVESSDDAIIGESFEGLITSWNSGAERVFGYSAEEVIGRPVSTLLPPNRPDDLTATLWRIREGQRVDHYQTERLTKDGRTIQVSLTLSPVRDAAGNLIGASAIARDVSDRARLESELRASHAQLQAILQSSGDGITVQDTRGNMLYANDAAARLIGFDSVAALLAASRIETLKAFEIMRDDGSPLPIDELPGRRALRGEYPPETVERYRILATGEERYSSVHARPVLDERGNVLFSVTTFRDITQLYREQQRLQFLDEASAVLASSLDYDKTLDRVAQIAVPEFADWAAVDIVEPDGTIKQVGLAHSDPSRISWARDLVRRRPPDPEASTGSAHVIRTGEAEFFQKIDIEQLEAAATDDEIHQILQELHLTSAITVPMRAGDRVMGALTLVYGESERQYFEADLRFAQELADRAGMAVQNARLYRDAEDALRVRDEFLGTISHDLRTPLTTIRGLTELLLRQVARPGVAAERLARSLQDIDGASRVMTRMIENLLDLSRSEAGRPLTLNLERVDLAALLRDVVNAQQRSTERHRIELSIPEDDVVGYWDEVRLERVMHNLLSNAIKYSPEGGRIGVSVACYDGESEPAMWAEIRVEDEGIGIPAGDIPRIFDRHFRAGNVTKGMPGLGIGLAGVAQSVDQHGGSIRVESEEGRGSSFIVRLPLDPNPPESE